MWQNFCTSKSTSLTHICVCGWTHGLLSSYNSARQSTSVCINNSAHKTLSIQHTEFLHTDIPSMHQRERCSHLSWQFSAESWDTSLMAFGNWSLRCETLSGAIILDVMSNYSLLVSRWQPSHSKNEPGHLKTRLKPLKTQLTEPRLGLAVRGQT